MWNLPGPGVNPCPLHWQVDYYPLHHQESPRSFTLLNSNHNHISQHYCHNYTQYLFWHSHLLYEVNTIISPISQMKTMRPARLTCPQSFFYHPMDCSLPGSSVHGICQAGILDWGAISFSRGSSWPRDQTRVSCIGRQFLYHWASRSKLWEIVEDRRAWQATAHGVAESDTTWELNNSRHSYTAAQLKPEISKRLY